MLIFLQSYNAGAKEIPKKTFKQIIWCHVEFSDPQSLGNISSRQADFGPPELPAVVLPQWWIKPKTTAPNTCLVVHVGINNVTIVNKQNHRTTRIGRGLRRSVVQLCFQSRVTCELRASSLRIYLDSSWKTPGLRQYNLSKKPIPVLDCTHEKIAPYIQSEPLSLYFMLLVFHCPAKHCFVQSGSLSLTHSPHILAGCFKVPLKKSSLLQIKLKKSIVIPAL